jgi:anti-sigma B factor antagonist
MEFYYAEMDKNVLILKADGDLNSEDSAKVVSRLGELIDSGLTKIIVDCSRMDYISSYGLGVLIRIHSRLTKRGGNVKLASVKGLIVQVLTLTHLNTLFEIYPDIDHALQQFASTPDEKKPPAQ